MAREGVLVDTSAWIAFFRGIEPVAAEVADLIETRRALRCGPVELELRRGLRAAEAPEVVRLWLGLEALAVDAVDFTKAGDLLRDLQTRGTTLPSMDGLIAAIAIRHDVALLAVDRHFDQVPTVTRWPSG